MNLRQERKLNMYFVTSGLIDITDAAIIKQMPRFNVRFENFKQVITEIKSAAQTQAKRTGGHAKKKESLKNEVIIKSTEIANRTAVFAFNEEDQTLEDIMTFVKSDFERMTVNEIVSNAHVIATHAGEVVTQLGEYNVTAEMVSALTDAANALDASIKTPRAAIVTRKRSTTEIAAMFTDADRLLKRLDRYVAMLENAEPAFFMDYHNSRMILDPATRKWSIVGTVKDQAGNPLQGVRVGVSGKPTTLTNATGDFHFPHLKAGEYPVAFALSGYEDQTANAAVANGSRAELNIVLTGI